MYLESISLLWPTLSILIGWVLLKEMAAGVLGRGGGPDLATAQGLAQRFPQVRAGSAGEGRKAKKEEELKDR